MTLPIEETSFLELIPLNPLNPIKESTHFYVQLVSLIILTMIP